MHARDADASFRRLEQISDTVRVSARTLTLALHIASTELVTKYRQRAIADCARRSKSHRHLTDANTDFEQYPSPLVLR
jgi:hypothetical protein